MKTHSSQTAGIEVTATLQGGILFTASLHIRKAVNTTKPNVPLIKAVKSIFFVNKNLYGSLKRNSSTVLGAVTNTLEWPFH